MPAITLSLFQREKLEYYFKFYQPSEQGFLDDTSVPRFMKRVVEFTKWAPDDVKTLHCQEIHEAFFEVLFERSWEGGGKQHKVSLEDWLVMWSNIIPGCMGIHNFPVWLRLLPRTLFQMMDTGNRKAIAIPELAAFYRDMVKIPEELAQTRAVAAYDAMTDHGKYPLDLDSYEMIFANFLIGKTAFGPGRHIFGCFEHSVTAFHLIEDIVPEEDEDMEDSPRGRRNSSTGGRSGTDCMPQAGVPYSKPKPMIRRDSYSTPMVG